MRTKLVRPGSHFLDNRTLQLKPSLEVNHFLRRGAAFFFVPAFLAEALAAGRRPPAFAVFEAAFLVPFLAAFFVPFLTAFFVLFFAALALFLALFLVLFLVAFFAAAFFVEAARLLALVAFDLLLRAAVVIGSGSATGAAGSAGLTGWYQSSEAAGSSC